MISRPIRLIKIAISITVLIGILLFAQQQRFHFAFSREINNNLQNQNMDYIEQTLQFGLNYPLGIGDKAAVERIISKLVHFEYIYSIEVRDKKGQLIATATADDVPTEKGVKIYLRTLTITDDRPVGALDIDDQMSSPTVLGTIKLRLTTYKTQDNLDSELSFHWLVLITTVSLIGMLVIAFAVFFRHGTRRVLRALEGIENKKYEEIKGNIYIHEINEIFQGVNSLSSALSKSESDFNKTNRIKQSLLNLFSKELNTPMKTLQGLLSMINDSVGNDDLDAEIVHYLRTCQVAADSVVDTLNKLNVFNLLDANNLRYRESVFNPECFFDDVYAEYQSKISSPIVFDVVANPLEDVEISQAKIGTDERKLSVIVGNVLENAIKYTSRGSIMIEWSLSAKGSDGYLTIGVKDTGIGIDAGNIHKVFDEYYREETDDTGFGLGLTIAKSFLEVLGGTIEIQSLKSMGTKVDIVIPVKVVKSIEQVSENLPQFDFSALIVDDNDNISQWLAQSLRQYGAQADVQKNPTQALTAIVENSYHFVFVDDRMKQIRGVDLARHIASTGKDVAIIYMTSLSDEASNIENIIAIKAAGAVVFELRKPILHSALEGTLRDVFNLRNTIKNTIALFSKDENGTK